MNSNSDKTKTSKSKDTLSQTESFTKNIRNVNPLGMRVLVKLIDDTENRTDSGLYLPEGAKEATQESLIGEVIEVASAIDKESKEETNISGIPLGAYVLIPKKAGVKVPWNDKIRIVETKDVLATIDYLTLT